jgi:hypothetical protein
MTRIRTQVFAVIATLLVTAMLSPLATGQDSQYRPEREQIPVPDCLTLSNAYSAALAGGYHPCSASTHEEWLKDISHWRTERRIRVGYDGARYSTPALQWTQSSFIQPQMMV